MIKKLLLIQNTGFNESDKLAIVNKLNEIVELMNDCQIEDGPVSFDDWDSEYSLVYKLYRPKLDREIKDRHGLGETLRNIIYRNRKAAWDACEQNDRKRTQPVVDAAQKVFDLCSKYFDQGKKLEAMISLLVELQALKTLEEK